jgi:hypothetical protein
MVSLASVVVVMDEIVDCHATGFNIPKQVNVYATGVVPPVPATATVTKPTGVVVAVVCANEGWGVTVSRSAAEAARLRRSDAFIFIGVRSSGSGSSDYFGGDGFLAVSEWQFYAIERGGQGFYRQL